MTGTQSEQSLHHRFTALLIYLADHGYADHVGTWVSAKLDNMPITGDELRSVLPAQVIAAFAEAAEIPEADAADVLAKALPDMVDAVTPAAELASEDEIEDLYRAWLENVIAAV
jgi:uncharacterized protein YidB (DUF937 family)